MESAATREGWAVDKGPVVVVVVVVVDNGSSIV